MNSPNNWSDLVIRISCMCYKVTMTLFAHRPLEAAEDDGIGAANKTNCGQSKEVGRLTRQGDSV
jgi:hypothetical protein